MDKQQTENVFSDNEEQQEKDVRSIKENSGTGEYKPTDEELKESALNAHYQEENRRSQKNAEKDAKYGDASSADSSRLPENQQPEDAHVPQG